MIDLKQFCSTEIVRVNLHNPFSRGKYTYATDGRVAVRVPRIMDWPDQDKPDPEKIFTYYFKQCPMGTILGDIPQVKETKEECPDCHGSGHAHDCPDCDCECETCDGDGKTDIPITVTVAIGEALYDSKYISRLMTLPGFKFAAEPPKGDAASFVFEGGEGLLMPLRYAQGQTVNATIQI